MTEARGLPGESVCSSSRMLSRGGRYEADPHAHHGNHRVAPAEQKAEARKRQQLQRRKRQRLQKQPRPENRRRAR